MLAVGSSEGGRRTGMSFGVRIEVATWVSTPNKADRWKNNMARGGSDGETETGNGREEALLVCSLCRSGLKIVRT